jgi:hypothetical protein
MLWLASFAFYQDKINVSLPEKYELKVALTPTYVKNFQPSKIAYADLTYNSVEGSFACCY